MKPIPLFGSGIKSYSEVVTAQRRLNCFYDLRSDGDKHELILRGTPGTLLNFTLPTFPVRGWRVVNNLLYVVGGAVLYSVTATGGIISIGTLAGSTALVSMDDNGVELIIVDGVGGYLYTLATGIFTTITDGNFPNGATTVAFLNGRFIVNKAGTRQFVVGQSYAGANWTPFIFGTKENSSDVLLAVEVLNGTLLLWGANSIEFWQDEGLSPLPFSRVKGATQTWGLAAVFSRAPLANTKVFLGQNPQGGVQILQLNGYTPVRISTSDIENLINSFVNSGVVISDAVALTYMVDGHPMYQLTFPSGNRSFLYDHLSKMWQEVQTGTALLARHYAHLGVVFNALNYVSDATNGNVYVLSSTVYSDNGALIKRQLVSRHIRNGGAPFGVDSLYLDMETGVGLQSGQGSDPQVMLQVSKDGGRTFGAERWKPLGKVGQFFSPRVIWNRLGMAVDFVFKITMTDPVKFTITSAYAESLDKELKGE
jgi:hypothetical protein